MHFFDADLITIRARLAEMGGLAEEQLARALEAVASRDARLAQDVVARDAEIDRREMALEELSIRTLALRHPVARDLRETIAALKIASTIERIGDLAKSVARRAIGLSGAERQRTEASILRMGALAQAQLSEVLDAYAMRDAVAALAVWRRDVEIDELYNSLFRELVSEMSQQPRLVSTGAQLMFIAKNIERIGDHSTFIAEMTYFVVNGEALSDDRPKGDPMFPLIDLETDVEAAPLPGASRGRRV
ncbi:MAG: phosphate signaling complex protein PhoU [Pseudomonadota bacterium]